MNKALLPLLLCCFIFPASGKDAGWQWYNEKINPKEKENKPVPAAPRQEPDIMQKLAALQTATKRALYEAILYPGVDNFVKYFRLQNYWTQQAGLFTMSAKESANKQVISSQADSLIKISRIWADFFPANTSNQ
ncbi:conjugal transfer protein TraF, partial [Klebsiella pneumoniae]|nr:conjugal transfer protein TraF [Klebsiella pneumoniae]